MEGSGALAHGTIGRLLERGCCLWSKFSTSFSDKNVISPVVFMEICSLFLKSCPSWMMPGSGWGQRIGRSISIGSAGHALSDGWASVGSAVAKGAAHSSTTETVDFLTFIILFFTGSWTPASLVLQGWSQDNFLVLSFGCFFFAKNFLMSCACREQASY